MARIPFSKPAIGRGEQKSVSKALRDGCLVGNGPYTKKAEEVLRKITGSRYAFLTTSATHALELAVMALGIGPGDEVICPSFTFVSTVNAIIRQGARPRFCEIEPATLNIDIDHVRGLINRRTKAVIPVHYAGFSCDMDRLVSLAAQRRIKVIEDAAQAIGARYKGKHLGTIGDIGALSFHATKNITCGEGGALLTSSRSIAEKAEIIREKGTNRNAFLRGDVDKYTWLDVGSSFIPSDLLAALLTEQLKKVDAITARRMSLFRSYYDSLLPLEAAGIIRLPAVRKFAKSNGHIFWFLVKDESTRDGLIGRLNRDGIQATFHYVPLHSAPYGRTILGERQKLRVTENVAARLVRLPLYPSLTKTETERVIRCTIQALTQKGCRS